MSDTHADLRAMLEALPGLSVTEASVAEVVKWLIHAPVFVNTLLAERDKLAKQLGNYQTVAGFAQGLAVSEELAKVKEALGEDRKKAPFIDDAVKLLRKERDALRDKVRCLELERDGLEAEVEWLRAHPAEPIPDEQRLMNALAQAAVRNAEAGADMAVANKIANALLAEGRRRMAAEREAKP